MANFREKLGGTPVELSDVLAPFQSNLKIIYTVITRKAVFIISKKWPWLVRLCGLSAGQQTDGLPV